MTAPDISYEEYVKRKRQAKDPMAAPALREESVREFKAAVDTRRRATRSKASLFSATLAGPSGPEEPQTLEEGQLEIPTPEERRRNLEIMGSIVGAIITPTNTLRRMFVAAGASGPTLDGLLIGSRAVWSGAGSVAGSEIGTEVLDIEDPNKELRRTRAYAEGAVAEVVGEGVHQMIRPIGRGVVRVGKKIPFVRRVLAPFAGKLEPQIERITQLLDEIAPGATLQPGKAVRAMPVDIPSNIAESSLTGSGKMQAGAQELVSSIEDYTRRYAENLSKGRTSEEVGAIVKNLVERHPATVTAQSRALYKSAHDLLSPVRVSTVALKEHLKKAVEHEEMGLGNPALKAIYEKVLEKGDSISFEEASILRTALMDTSGMFTGGTKPLRYAKQASATGAEILRKTMETAANELSPEGYAIYQKAQKLWAEEIRGTNGSKIVAKIAKAYPEEVGDVLLRERRPTPIKEIRRIMEAEEPGSWEAVQGELLEKMLYDASDPISGEVSGSKFLRRLKKFAGHDEKAGLEALPNGTYEDITLLGHALARAQAKAGGNRSGSMLIQFMQASAFTAVAAAFTFGNYEQESLGTAAVLLIGPRALAQVLNDRQMAHWLTVGVEELPGSRNIGRIWGNLLTRMVSEGIDFTITNQREMKKKMDEEQEMLQKAAVENIIK